MFNLFKSPNRKRPGHAVLRLCILVLGFSITLFVIPVSEADTELHFLTGEGMYLNLFAQVSGEGGIRPDVDASWIDYQQISPRECKLPRIGRPRTVLSKGKEPPTEEYYAKVCPMDARFNLSITVCADVYDADCYVLYKSILKDRWIDAIQLIDYYSVADPSAFSFDWKSSNPGLRVLQPPTCAVYTGSWGSDFGSEELVVTLTIDDVGTIAPGDPPITKTLRIKVD